MQKDAAGREKQRRHRQGYSPRGSGALTGPIGTIRAT